MIMILPIALTLLVSLTQVYSSPVVVTPAGTISGWERPSRDGHLYEAFTGIPFAKPPVGKLRFQPPKRVETWNGVLNATATASPCLQFMFAEQGSEDCLYLNVYRPQKYAVKRLPVIVHVHGGAFQIGNAGARESADYIMDEEVILVTLQYRLNLFGFLSLGDKVLPGNYGIKDQVMALRWINRNIASFGGDPNSVTLIGESAGAASTHILLKSPATKDLVTRAVSDSGSVNPVWSMRKPSKGKTASLKVIASVGCSETTSDQILECLQKVSASELMKATTAVTDFSNPTFVPVIEPADAEDAVAPEDLSLVKTNKPWITSLCNGEYVLFEYTLSPFDTQHATSNLNEYLENWIKERVNYDSPVQAKAGARILADVYFPEKQGLTNISHELSQMDAAVSFNFPAFYNLANHDGPKWVYRFEYVGELSVFGYVRNTPNEKVAGHAETTLYYFNQRSQFSGASPTQTPEDYQVSKQLIKYLVNFAYYDNPTPEGSAGVFWSPFKSNEILRITNDGVTQEGSHYYQQFQNDLNLWSYVIGWSS